MRFIGVLRNAVKTGDEYPNRDAAHGGRTGNGGVSGGGGTVAMELIDEKEKFGPPSWPFSSERIRLGLLSRDISEKCIPRTAVV